MSDYTTNYSTGWYSISPAFAWWNFNTHRLAEIKARREATRITDKEQRKAIEDKSKITEGTISVYAQQKKQKKVNKKLDLSLIRSNIVL